ncbi:hypothetical protein K0H71_22535 [Bacillus sp. IITD106]|nr:hypothetical protein [Bacillus sp. IITD106]
MQNARTRVEVTAKDGNGKLSASRILTVVRAAPNIPIVNSVTNKSTAVTGKTEKGALVTVVIGKKSYKVKANSQGNFKVVIPKQKAKTTLYVSAKDFKGNVSAARVVIVKKNDGGLLKILYLEGPYCFVHNYYIKND